MNTKETEFMNELEAALHARPSRPALLMSFTIAAFVVFFILWAAITEVDEVTRGEGQVVPTQEIQTVQSLEGGIIQDILVAEGDVVKKGQVLLRISDIQYSSEEQGAEAHFFALRAKKARLQAEANGKEFEAPEDIAEKMPQLVANEKALYNSRQKELTSVYAIEDEKIKKAQADLKEVDAQISRFSESARLLKKELEITKKMVEQRAVPQLDQIRQERELADLQGQINTNVQRKKGLQADLSAAENERATRTDQFRSKSLEDLSEVEAQISALEQSLKSIGDRVYRTELRAPVDGVVNKIAIKTVGGVVEPAMHLVEIVPEDDQLKIVAKVKPDEIAFLSPGQQVKVKVTAYDPQKFGTLDGKLSRIGATTVSDREGNAFFEIEVRTAKNYLGTEQSPLPITPGMVAHVDVITGKRTILHYLMKPVRRGFDRALRER
ncbi:MAG: HlyD family type I secretion periplasmic adaptor subunit [Alphaproteobacteria bacterium]|nr:HlyD family type I secretion periplasmic adaptor subunit [Alphaproteobacteria bacterium]